MIVPGKFGLASKEPLAERLQQGTMWQGWDRRWCPVAFSQWPDCEKSSYYRISEQIWLQRALNPALSISTKESLRHERGPEAWPKWPPWLRKCPRSFLFYVKNFTPYSTTYILFKKFFPSSNFVPHRWFGSRIIFFCAFNIPWTLGLSSTPLLHQ